RWTISWRGSMRRAIAWRRRSRAGMRGSAPRLPAHPRISSRWCLTRLARRCSRKEPRSLDARDLGDESGDEALDLIRRQVVASLGVGLTEIAADDERAQPRLGKSLRLCVREAADDLHRRSFAHAFEDRSRDVVEIVLLDQ